MSGKVFYTKYVRHEDVIAHERVGWLRTDALEGTNHGAWSVLMVWEGEGEAPEVARALPIAARRQPPSGGSSRAASVGDGELP